MIGAIMDAKRADAVTGKTRVEKAVLSITRNLCKLFLIYVFFLALQGVFR